MKDLKDYLHLYIGCECMIGDLSWKPETNLHGLAPGVDPNYGRPIRTVLDAHAMNVYAHETTLILRPLSDMTEDEDQVEFPKHNRGEKIDMHWYPEGFVWLLSHGFDLFNLIPEGLALDKTTLTQQ